MRGIQVFFLATLLSLSVGLDNGVAGTPPMGFNTWNLFKCKIDHTLIRQIAQEVVANGMAEAGYKFINLDDCWQGGRDASGNIYADKVRFPDIKGLIDYVHSLGLKFGLYTDVGKKTCAKYEGSYGHEKQDAMTFANWGVDYVKVDWCAHEYVVSAKVQYERFREAFNATGRPIVFSICNWGEQEPWTWGKAVGNLWRTSMDINPHWYVIANRMELQVNRSQYAGPGGWNDPDMLEVGNGALTLAESRTHFGQWAMMAAPLIAGNDIRNMTKETREILTAPEIIAVDQDDLGRAGDLAYQNKTLETQVWTRPLSDGSFAVSCLNLGPLSKRDVVINFELIGKGGQSALIRDLWERKDLGRFAGSFTCTALAPHASMMLRLTF